MEASKLSDSELYELCKMYGGQSRAWMRKFEGLLPEVCRRRLYKRRGFAGIYEFAGKLAGMSHEKVDKILRIASRLEDKPELKNLLESGEVGWSKIEKVTWVATPESDKKWAESVKELDSRSLDILVQNNRGKLADVGKVEPVKEAFEYLSFPVSKETRFMLLEAQQKLSGKEKLSLNETLYKILKGAQVVYRVRAMELCPDCVEKRAREKEEVSRHIPQEVQDVVRARQKNRCIYTGCNKPGEIFHHTRRFALIQSHDPAYIVWVCKTHERLAHSGLIENEGWKIKNEPDKNSAEYNIDRKVMAHRKSS